MKLPSLLKRDTTDIFEPDEVCKLFAGTSNLCPLLRILPFGLLSALELPLFLSECVVTAEAIEKKLVVLDISKGSGPDGNTAGVSKSCNFELSTLLCHLFNLNLFTGIFPSILKEGYVIPFFKSGNCQDVTTTDQS